MKSLAECPKPGCGTDRGHLPSLLALFVIVLGAKLVLIRYFGSGVPFFDQWDAEAAFLYKPYLESTLSFFSLFASHNEHRIFFTRIYSLILFELNGGWDPLLQMVANAFLHCVAIVLLMKVMRPLLDQTCFFALAMFSALVFALPIGWENTLAGFQSQFYLLLITAFLSMIYLVNSRAFSRAWMIGILSGIASYFCMASGALTLAAALAVMAIQLLFGLRRGAREVVGAGLLLAICGLMVVNIHHVVDHDVLKAHSLREFLGSTLSIMAYPHSRPALAFVSNLPVLVFAGFVLARRPHLNSSNWSVIGVAVWFGAQAIALSYGRGSGGELSRYLDLVVIGLPLNFFALLLWCDGRSPYRVIFLFMWLVLVVPPLLTRIMNQSVPEFVARSGFSAQQIHNVNEFLKTYDPNALQGKERLAIPYPSPERLAALLVDPTIRLALPEAIRPHDINPSELFKRTYFKGHLRPMMQAVKNALLQYAVGLAGLGLALAFASGLFLRGASGSGSSLSPGSSVSENRTMRGPLERPVGT